MSKLKKYIRNRLNAFVRNSYWFNNVYFQDCKKFWVKQDEKLDVVNLGSNSGKYGFDYNNTTNIKGENWAMGPQSLVEDFEILKKYNVYLKDEAIVIIPLCPFSCLGGSSLYMPDKYYSILDDSSIPQFNIKKKQEVEMILENPIHYYPLLELVRDIKIKSKQILGIKKRIFKSNDITLKYNATSFINGWKSEFGIKNFYDELSEINKKSYADSVDILSEMISFCLERGFKPILTIPPVSRHLLSYFTPEMKKLFIYDFIKKANSQNVPFIDFFDHPDFKDKNEYFLNSLFLNQKGAKAYTSALLKQLKKVEVTGS